MRAPILLSGVFGITLLVSLSVGCGGGNQTPPETSASAAATSKPSAPSGPSKPESDKVTWKDDASGSCHAVAASGDLSAAVSSMAKACAPTMHATGTPTAGTGTEGTASMVTTLPLKAQAKHCYRVFGVAESSVKDLDIAIMDSSGKSAGEDGTDTSASLVREGGPICFTSDDAASVNIAVASGTGKWAVSVWSD